MRLFQLFSIIIYFVDICLGIILVKFNGLDIGLMIIGIVGNGFFCPVLALADLPRSLNQTFASAKRVFKILDEKPVVEKT